MFKDYRKAVFFDYKMKREDGNLSLNLTHPTPRKLIDECLYVLNSRDYKKDEALIKKFFNAGKESSDYSDSIRRFDRDKLRPLNSFLRELTETSDDHNIELLAWLIDFERRPYKFGEDYQVYQGIPKETSIEVPQFTPASPAFPPSKRRVKRKALLLLSILPFLISGIYLYNGNRNIAYVCESGKAEKYHLSAKCPSLKNCKNNHVSINITEAKNNGKTLCAWEQ